jgi:predicted amidohydrolase YtcJ
VLAAGSDAPVNSRDPRPFFNITAAVFRANESGEVLNASEVLDTHTAIAAYTINGARALQQEDLTGSIEVGKKADLVVIDRNIVQLADQGASFDILETKVLLTLFDGSIVYEGEK